MKRWTLITKENSKALWLDTINNEYSIWLANVAVKTLECQDEETARKLFEEYEIVDDYKVKQICPAHADHISYYKEKYLNDMFNEGKVIGQRKYDGERMIIHFNKDEVYCTSRRISKKTGKYQENQDKLVNLPKLPNVGYTVIDCECYSNTWSDIVGILHSLPERAHELQKTVPVRFAIFDCLWYDGEDVTSKPYYERLAIAKRLVCLLNYYGDYRFHLAQTFDVCTLQDAYDCAEIFWNKGLEGIVIKALNKAYYDKGAMLKIKRHETVDVVVYGYQPGTGKYANTVGALYVGYYVPETNSIKHISNVNCGTDADRDFWKAHFGEKTECYEPTMWKVLEVKTQEVTDKSLRHPVYVRVRDDKTYSMCTRETIFKE